ncbi:MAG: DUF4160 domain-containing protein [Gammaproteobacteria bacterium]|nr:DUF4160 domain-containing protein [Gammaproteobacteria bacterium]MDD9869349.1 DUF4160 domain-containing protein [Gammaproteobacteria bacterium]
MPAISMFHGIIIRMPENPRTDAPPYFTASYTDFEAQVDIERAEVVTGNLPEKQTHLVEAWGEIYRDELMANWRLMKEHEEPFRINPLK